MKPLEERFESMLKPRATATDIKGVIGEIDAEIGSLNVAADAAHERSIAPAASDEDAYRAREDEQGFRFAIERWTARNEALAQRFLERTESEASQAQKREYAAAAAEAAQLAIDLAARVPALFEELADLFRRLEASDRRVEAANRSKPGDAPRITPAEPSARGFSEIGVWPNLETAERLTAVVLPRFSGSGRIWPSGVGPGPAGASPVISGGAYLARLAAEREAGKRRFMVKRTDKRHGTTLLQHADGMFNLGSQEYPCWLYADQVEACRSAGMLVEPIAAEAP
jgi:hypothetical protein